MILDCLVCQNLFLLSAVQIVELLMQFSFCCRIICLTFQLIIKPMVMKVVAVSECIDNVMQSHCFHQHRSNDIIKDVKNFRTKNQNYRDLVTIISAIAHSALLLHDLALFIKEFSPSSLARSKNAVKTIIITHLVYVLLAEWFLRFILQIFPSLLYREA